MANGIVNHKRIVGLHAVLFFGVLSFVCSEIRKSNHVLETLRKLAQRYAQLTINNSIFPDSYQSPTPTQKRFKGRGDKIVLRAVIKAKVGELEEEVRE